MIQVSQSGAVAAFALMTQSRSQYSMEQPTGNGNNQQQQQQPPIPKAPPRQNGRPSISTGPALVIPNSPSPPLQPSNCGSKSTEPTTSPAAAAAAASATPTPSIHNPNAHLPPPYNLPPVGQQPPPPPQSGERKRIVRKVIKAPEKAERVLYCLTLRNPIRRLCIGIVEWKYPFHYQMNRERVNEQLCCFV